jgi:hypothetical protein
VLPKTPPKFSKENFGDKFERDQKNKQSTKRICRATIFVKTFKTMSDEEWKLIMEGAIGHLAKEGRARAHSVASTGATLVPEKTVEDPEEDFVMF